MAITVTVKFFASLAAFSPCATDAPACDIAIDEHATIEQLITQLGIPADKVRTISLNGKIVKTDAMLADGDSLTLYPAIAGG